MQTNAALIPAKEVMAPPTTTTTTTTWELEGRGYWGRSATGCPRAIFFFTIRFDIALGWHVSLLYGESIYSSLSLFVLMSCTVERWNIKYDISIHYTE